MTQWRPDVLGDEFECTDIELEPDVEGPVVATLVRALPTKLGWFRAAMGHPRLLEDVQVLYVHGWSDYFFQKRLARFFTELGARFYALDLRKYGRSLREWQTHGYITDLRDYDAEINRAVEIIHDETQLERKLLLLGHSTGGLVLSLWANRNQGVADGVVLNSPWLALQLGSTVRSALKPVVNKLARISPTTVALPQLDLGFYVKAQEQMTDPEDLALVNTQWRPRQSFPVLSACFASRMSGVRFS